MTIQLHSHTPFHGSVSQRVASQGGEASGLIDVRTMGAVLAATDAHAELPSFGGLSLPPLMVTTERPERPERPETGAVAAVPRSQTPMLALLGVLTLGVVGLAGYVVSLPAPQAAPPVVYKIAPSVLASADVRDDEDDAPAARIAAVVEDEEAAPVGPGKPVKERKAKPARPGKPSEVMNAAPVSEKPAPVAPAPKTDYGVDCILGKAACSEKPAEKVVTERPAAAAPSDLPEKLEQADISAGTSAARASAASACAKLAKGGEKVQIKLSIAGPTGAVIGASALEDAGNTQLAACVVGEFKSASFRKVQKQQTGTVVTVKF